MARHRRLRERCFPAHAEQVNNLAQLAQPPDLIRANFRRAGQFILQRGKNFDAFNRINPQIRVQPHLQIKHVFGVSGLFSHDFQQNIGNVRRRFRLNSRRFRARAVAVRGLRRARAEHLHDLPQRPNRADLRRRNFRRSRQFMLQCGKNFDALNRINPQIRVQPHLQIEHVFGVSGLFSHDFQQDRFNLRRVRCGDFNRRRGGLRRGLGDFRAFAQQIDHLAQRPNRADLLRRDFWRAGQFFLQGGQNFDALNRVNAQVRIQAHIQFEHVRRVAGLFRDDRHHDLGDAVLRGCRLRLRRRWRDYRLSLHRMRRGDGRARRSGRRRFRFENGRRHGRLRL